MMGKWSQRAGLQTTDLPPSAPPTSTMNPPALAAMDRESAYMHSSHHQPVSAPFAFPPPSPSSSQPRHPQGPMSRTSNPDVAHSPASYHVPDVVFQLPSFLTGPAPGGGIDAIPSSGSAFMYGPPSYGIGPWENHAEFYSPKVLSAAQHNSSHALYYPSKSSALDGATEPQNSQNSHPVQWNAAIGYEELTPPYPFYSPPSEPPPDTSRRMSLQSTPLPAPDPPGDPPPFTLPGSSSSLYQSQSPQGQGWPGDSSPNGDVPDTSSPTHDDSDSNQALAELGSISAVAAVSPLSMAVPPTVVAPAPSLPSQFPHPPVPPSAPRTPPSFYSATGFDIIGILSRVASRPSPKVMIGPVDLTCSFTVADAKRYDQPIIYASPTFSQLTGYAMSEIVGQNCRFLQSPQGHVEMGASRTYTDGSAVSYIRKNLAAGKECQASLINYRKGGQPFINLVTIIPIKWDPDDDEPSVLVGFQVDLVDQPNAIIQTLRDGTHIVNYSMLGGPDIERSRFGSMSSGLPGFGFGNDRSRAPLSTDLREILASIRNKKGGGGSIESGEPPGWNAAASSVTGAPAVRFIPGDRQERHDFNMMLLEKSDDFIHVLSLKGCFLYASPSVTKILEYAPEELIGKSISDFTHPSDIVPVMRELKESSFPPIDEGGHPSSSFFPRAQREVHLLLRIRRKTSGYVWIESSGRLHCESGKGRKAIILSGRVREMPRMSWANVSQTGGLADRECWAQIAVASRLFLVVSQGISEIGGQAQDEVVGTLITDHIAGEGKEDVIRALADVGASTGGDPQSVRCTWKHRQGLSVDVIVSFFPQEPTPELHPETATSSPSHRSLPSILVCHIRMASDSDGHSGRLSPNAASRRSSSSKMSLTVSPSRSLFHQPSANVFEELDTTRGTSWQYELQQLRLANIRMREEIENLSQEEAAGPTASPEPDTRPSKRRRRVRDAGDE